MSRQARQALSNAQTLALQGRTAKAEKLFRQIAKTYPGTEEARLAMAALSGSAVSHQPDGQLRLLYKQGQFKKLIETSAKLPAKLRQTAPVQTLIGGAEMALSRFDRAETAFRRVVNAIPDRPAGHNNLGLALRAQGKLRAARDAFEQAIRLRADYGDAHNGLGMVLQDEGDWSGAQARFLQASKLKPNDPEIWTNLGNMYQKQNDLQLAFAAYRKALAIAPNHANAHYNFALARRAALQLPQAIEHYQAAIKARPNFAMAHNNLGNAFLLLGELPLAEAALRQAVTIDPEDAEIHKNLGSVLKSMGRFDEAVQAYEAALRIAPNHATAAAARFYLLAQMCDWHGHSEFAQVAEALGVTDGAVAPFDLLALEDAPERQKLRAERFAQENFGETSLTVRRPAVGKRPKRLRVGYFSADFRSHPVARLIAGTFAAHDRDRFELYGYSFGPHKDDALRRELESQFSKFTDIRLVADTEAARLIAEDQLDIAIDLTGHTQHSRTGLFAHRVAPVQINYLGFPGTSGASFMDYIIADPVVVPPEEEAHLTEAVLRLPRCYQPNDNRRDVPRDLLSRDDHGLPENAVVLCCFNSANKITPREFAIWMRILARVPKAVLWLLESSRWTKVNLTKAAAEHGVDPGRLIFAPRVSNQEHLARHQHADLFLDTFAYTAHTTGSDALWMGVPIVTLLGRQFAARVCASLLMAVDMPDLITHSEADYENRILALAQDPGALTQLRQRLEARRGTVALFDTTAHTRALEAAFDEAHAMWRASAGG